MIPDIVMSPLGFPSRMTMGKLLEILMGKAVGLSGSLDDGLEDDCFDGWVPQVAKSQCFVVFE